MGSNKVKKLKKMNISASRAWWTGGVCVSRLGD
jgi:hypothetical protein